MKEIILSPNDKFLKQLDCNNNFVYDPSTMYPLERYPEKYKIFNEFFKILKGQSPLNLNYSIECYETSLGIVDNNFNLDLFKKILNIYLDKSGFTRLVKDYIIVLFTGIPEDILKNSFTEVSSVIGLDYYFLLLFDKPLNFENDINPRGGSSFRSSFDENFQRFILFVLEEFQKNKKILDYIALLSFEDLLIYIKDYDKNNSLESFNFSMIKYHPEGTFFNREIFYKSPFVWHNLYWYQLSFVYTIITKHLISYNYAGSNEQFFFSPYGKENMDITGYGICQFYINDLKKEYNLI